MTERYDDGMAVRREVLGDTHVDGAEAAKDRLRRAVSATDHGRGVGNGLGIGSDQSARALDADPGNLARGHW